MAFTMLFSPQRVQHVPWCTGSSRVCRGSVTALSATAARTGGRGSRGFIGEGAKEARTLQEKPSAFKALQDKAQVNKIDFNCI